MQEENPRSLFFRERLGTLLTERGISQRQLAAATKLTPQSISNYVRGTRSLPAAEELYALAKYFNVSMESLLGSDNDQEASKDKKVVIHAPSPAKMRRITKQIERIAKELKSLVEEINEFTA